MNAYNIFGSKTSGIGYNSIHCLRTGGRPLFFKVPDQGRNNGNFGSNKRGHRWFWFARLANELTSSMLGLAGERGLWCRLRRMAKGV